MATLDYWLLARVEALAHAFQRLAGKTCNWLLIQSWNAIAFSLATISALAYSNGGALAMQLSVTAAIVAALTWANVAICARLNLPEGMDARSYERLAAGTPNPVKSMGKFTLIRRVELALTPLVIACGAALATRVVTAHPVAFITALLSFWTMNLCSSYLMACDPIPRPAPA